ncbi:hypothetical protein [Peribacillus frigoritolerans]|uniref:hypothetical protein n=1 Tax=Peribacillus frigoritolerans TaxID=450367 RepID=UPI00105A51F9|nr:hypothetical protein [Peribacillus frigoritolerans]TDL78982.1 hypothetical protein E2R53_16195 [Peribacillus frigoritolerans]
MRRRKPSPLIPIAMIAAAILLLIGLFHLFTPSSPKKAVELFYTAEQTGNFGGAWDLFHPLMQDRFTKNAYVTERSHIYMSHYGVTTFSFEVLKQKKVRRWRMAKGAPVFNEARLIKVRQTFKSKFGTFDVLQDVYVVKEKGDWKIVWEYE